MSLFTDFKISTPLRNALEDLGLENPTPVQEQAFPVVMSGKDVVGIAQTGTGKTFAYLLEGLLIAYVPADARWLKRRKSLENMLPLECWAFMAVQT